MRNPSLSKCIRMGSYNIKLIKRLTVSCIELPTTDPLLCDSHLVKMRIRLLRFPSNPKRSKFISMNGENFFDIVRKECTKRPDPPSAPTLPPPAEITATVEMLAMPTLPKKQATKSTKKAVSLPKAKTQTPVVVQLTQLPIRSLQDYALDVGDQRDVIFVRRLEETGRLGDAYVRQLPPMQKVWSYIAELKEKPLWYKSSQESIINSKTLKFPQMDVLTRDYIMGFMRTPLKGEMECNNPNCESERLGKFKIRALPVASSTWCYLCHLYYTNRLYFESLNRKRDDARVFQIHHFMVQVDVEGEYRLDKTLMGDKNVQGIFGPFPLYNCHNYTVTELKNGCKGWIESDVMVFRLSQTM